MIFCRLPFPRSRRPVLGLVPSFALDNVGIIIMRFLFLCFDDCPTTSSSSIHRILQVLAHRGEKIGAVRGVLPHEVHLRDFRLDQPLATLVG